VEARVFGGLRDLILTRAATPHLHTAVPAEVLDLDDPQLLVLLRRHPVGPLLAVSNLTERDAFLPGDVGRAVGLGRTVDRLSGRTADAAAGVELGPVRRRLARGGRRRAGLSVPDVYRVGGPHRPGPPCDSRPGTSTP
jgi:hypothetical protein